MMDPKMRASKKGRGDEKGMISVRRYSKPAKIKALRTVPGEKEMREESERSKTGYR